jgi:hypothetical protein
MRLLSGALNSKTMEGLKKHLESNPHIKAVFFNESGEWLFHKRGEFSIEKTREEVLGVEGEEEASTEKKTAKEVIASIREAQSVGEVQTLIEGDERKSVLAEADKKIESLTAQ